MATVLKRLKIHQFRRVRPGTELVFDPEWNILLGKNATGKTTLLDLISRVISGDFELDEYCHLEYELAGPGWRLENAIEITPEQDAQRLGVDGTSIVRGPSRRTNPQVKGSARFVAEDPSADITILIEGDSVRVSPDGPPVPLDPAYVHFEILNAVVANEGGGRIFPGPFGPPTGPLERTRFDEALVSFLAVATASFGAVTRRGQAAILTIRGWPFHHLPKLLLGDRMTRAVESSSDFDLFPTEVPFLTDAVNLLGFDDAQMRFPFREKKVAKDTDSYEYGPVSFRFHRADGSIIPHDHLSFGQKRMLAFLVYLDANPDVIIADELVNGLHHEWIEAAMQRMGDRQKFLTSQNPLLLDYLSFSSPEQVQSRFVRCTLEDDEMVWQNLAPDDARRFYSAYEAGIQHVGEILRTKGLW